MWGRRKKKRKKRTVNENLFQHVYSYFYQQLRSCSGLGLRYRQQQQDGWSSSRKLTRIHTAHGIRELEKKRTRSSRRRRRRDGNLCCVLESCPLSHIKTKEKKKGRTTITPGPLTSSSTQQQPSEAAWLVSIIGLETFSATLPTCSPPFYFNFPLSLFCSFHLNFV